MVREIVIPKSQNYNLHIPEEYINQEVEILVFPISQIENQIQKTFEDLTKETAGLLAKQKVDPLTWQEEARSEWNEREEILNRLKHNNLSSK